MKSLRIFLSMALFGALLAAANPANAQYIERKTVDSVMTTGTQYFAWQSTKNGTTGFQITAVKKSGTVAGTVILEHSIDTFPTTSTRIWTQVGSQSLTLTDVANQGAVFPISTQSGNAYRFKVVTTGGTFRVYSAYLRR